MTDPASRGMRSATAPATTLTPEPANPGNNNTPEPANAETNNTPKPANPDTNNTPKPANADGNDWKSLDTNPLESFEPLLQATVVVPYYQAPDALALTLAGLERQRYPRHLFEVIVVDDGSDPPLKLPERSPLDIRVIHQPDLGFGLARARNNGARAARGDIVVFLDCDMIPNDEWLAAHARWHHAASDAMSIGFRRHLDVVGVSADDVRNRSGTLDELFAGRQWDRPEWIEAHMVRTAELTSSDDDLFRVASGGNLAMSRDFYWEVGGNDESFTQWGAEDIEFGYRAFTLGALLVPERRALCWHQGEGATPSPAETRSLEQQRAKLSQLIAHRGFRNAKPGRSFTVPQYVVSVATEGADADAQRDTVERLLSGDVHDLVVWVEQQQPADEHQAHAAKVVQRLLSGDPRVRFGPQGGAPRAFAASQFHIFVQAGSVVAGDLVSGLRRQLGTAECAAASQRDGSVAVLVRARRLHRELRRGLAAESITAAALASRLLPPSATSLPAAGASLPGGSEERWRATAAAAGAPAKQAAAPREVAAADAREGSPINAAADAREGPRLPRLRKLGRLFAYTVAEARAVRSPTDAARLARTIAAWITAAVRWRLRWIVLRLRRAGRLVRRAALRLRRAAKGRPRSKTIRPAAYSLGPSIAATGPRSTAALAAWARLHTESSAPTRVVLCDGRPLPSTWTPKAGAAVVSLGAMAPTAATPAFDAEQINPTNSPAASKRSASLGPRGLLPAGHPASRRVSAADLARARRYHHVADVAAYHADAQARAGAVAALVAGGAVVRLCDGGAEVAELLGERLFRLLTDPRIDAASEAEREALSVEMRREALRTHSLRARARQVCEAASVNTQPLPLVSVLLATRRPDRVAAAVASVAVQTYPRIELVLAAHGDGFDRARLEALATGCDPDACVLVVPAGRVLGEVLNEALEHSRGDLVTKFDDDDHYGPEHLWDLVLAHEYSRATLVGKAAEYVYLEGTDRTLRRFRGGAERFGSKLTLAGGAMIIARSDLDAVVGWQAVPSGVDRALMNDVTAGGGRLYRTHGRGYLLVRHARGHTWEADDEYFLEQAVEVRDGCDLGFAGVA